MDGDKPTSTTESAREGRVTLVRGGHRWRFICQVGDEPTLVRALAGLAVRDDAPLDWFDAALVSHQLADELGSGFHKIT